MAYKSRQYSWFFWLYVLVEVFILFVFLIQLLTAVAANDETLLIGSAIIMAVFFVFFTLCCFSLYYFEIWGGDEQLVIKFGPVPIFFCCTRMAIKYSNISSFVFSQSNMWQSRGIRLNCSRKLTFNTNGYGFIDKLCCDSCETCQEYKICELKLKETQRWFCGCCKVDDIAFSTNDVDGLRKVLRKNVKR